MCLLPSLKWSSTVSSLGIVQWNFTRRDHPGDPWRVSGSGPVTRVLFEFGASHSFIIASCVKDLGLEVETLEESLHVSSPLGTRVRVDKIC